MIAEDFSVFFLAAALLTIAVGLKKKTTSHAVKVTQISSHLGVRRLLYYAGEMTTRKTP